MEYHILIAWNKAGISSEIIEKTLLPSLRIRVSFNYSWDRDFAKENYAAFYGEKLEDIQYKVDHCGDGPFRVYLIEDSSPQYEYRSTSSGERKVNVNLFDLKQLLRKMTGGGHLIHASDTYEEANLNCVGLFSMLPCEVINYYSPEYYGSPISINRNIGGALGWESWNELFEAINKVTKYVVLRNVQTVLNDSHDLHGDTDLLVENFHSAITVASARKQAFGKDRVLYSVFISKSEQLVDFRFVGDGYLCKEWEMGILDRRVTYKDTDIFVPCNSDYQYSILYHALVQKPSISDDYKIIISNKFGNCDNNELQQILEKYINENGYSFCKPNDNSVFIHPDYFCHIKLPIKTKMINWLKVIKYRGGNDGGNSELDQKVYKILSKGYYMVIEKLRQCKKGIKKIWNH